MSYGKWWKIYSGKKISQIIGVSQSRISRIINQCGLKRDKSVLNLNKRSIDINYFEKIDNYDKAYWLGFICADGSINKTNNKMTLVSKDLENIEKFKKSVKSEHTISTLVFSQKGITICYIC